MGARLDDRRDKGNGHAFMGFLRRPETDAFLTPATSPFLCSADPGLMHAQFPAN
jgi:hypothetical protein